MNKYVWRALATTIVLLFTGTMVLAAALFLVGAPMTGSPGFFKRTVIYLTEHAVETSPDSIRIELRPVEYDMPQAELYETALKAARGLRWKVVRADATSRTIQAVAPTPLFGFESDVRIQVELSKSRRSTLRVRAASRTPRGDLGANTSHVLKLYQAIDIVTPPLRR